MSAFNADQTRFFSGKTIALCMAVTVVFAGQSFAQGGGNSFFNQGVVGGVQVDTNGIVTGKMQKLDAQARANLSALLNTANSDINKSCKLRVVSLRGLEAAVAKAQRENTPLPSEVQFLAGLQRIEYLILSPGNDDILIAGPGEGWMINDQGVVVGKDSGAPVLHLEDLIIAIRSAENARTGQGISVSIDPTEEGMRRLRQFRQQYGFNTNLKAQYEQAAGPQQIRLTGVPGDSRYAQILVTADYQMKRLSMGLENAPINNMPSLLSILKSRNVRSGNMAPRFWMECNYDAIAKSQDGEVYQLRGQGVKTLTEAGFINKQGEAVDKKGKQNKFAKQWADNMTEKFDELSKAQPVFRELRNIIDMSVVAALIEREGLLEQVDLQIPTLKGQQNVSLTPSRNVPKQVPSQCSFINIRGTWLMTTSGGVQVDSWSVAANTETVSGLETVSKSAKNPTADRFWWNATN